MVKKKGQKSAQSKKKLDLAAAVEAAEQGEEESDLSKLNLDEHTVSAAKTEIGNMNDNEAGVGNNEHDDDEEDAFVMNYNPPEEGPVTEETGKVVITVLFKFCGRTRDYKPAFLFCGAIRHIMPSFTCVRLA